ncbi:alpha/beta hydrolase family protein [Arthrobacter flavus]|uniref:Alpha/beta hydrolase family protein n=1 Tax=Arthrobacter flavus TaxID=95172 RepID=A0ABW4Q579_9MICC
MRSSNYGGNEPNPEVEGSLPNIAGATPLSLRLTDVVLGGYAWWADHEAPAFLLLHGWGEDASAWKDVAEQIRSRSWSAISVSLRGWRGSSGTDDYGLSAAKDIGQVLSWIRQNRKVSSVVLLGFSMGGLMACLAAADQDELGGVVIVNSPSDLPSFYQGTSYEGVRRYLAATLQPSQWHESSPISHVQRLVHPMLIVAGSRDVMTPPSQSRRMAKIVPTANLLELPDMKHAPSWEEWDTILTEIGAYFRF